MISVYKMAAIGLLTSNILACGNADHYDHEEAPTNVDGEQPQSVGWEYIDPENGEVYLVDHNRRVEAVVNSNEHGIVEPADSATGEFDVVGQALTKLTNVDHSGYITTEYVTCDATSIQTDTASCGCSVSPGYVLVGGGGIVSWSQPGAMLYESRPADADNNGPGTTWLAASKAHMGPASHTLTCQAVGMKIKDNSGNWLSAATLKSYISYDRTTVPGTQAPSGQCDVANGKFVIGGGARSNWTGNGQLLTESYANSASSWYAKSKAHMVDDQASLYVYCIGISPSIPNFGTFLITRTSKRKHVNYWDTSVSLINGPEYIALPTCAGGRATYSDEGRLLTALGVGPNSVWTASKDHWVSDGGWTYTNMVKVRKQP